MPLHQASPAPSPATSAPAPFGLLLAGCDVGDREFWYWRTEAATPGGDEPEPHPARLDQADVSRVGELLASALPASGPSTVSVRPPLRPPEDLPDDLAALWSPRRRATIYAAHRVLTGPLSSPDAERAFSAELGRLLLPHSLQVELLRQYELNHLRPVPLRILPAQQCLPVPWELLTLSAGADDLRLIEVADVSTVAPVLPRDAEPVEPSAPPATAPSPAPDPTPLVLVDPDSAATPGIGQVLGRAAEQAWRDRYPADSQRQQPRSGSAPDPTVTAAIHSTIDRVWLSEALTATPRSRFTYVGHVTASPDNDDASAALMLGCDKAVFGHEDVRMHMRPFSARDAVCGTLGAPQLIAALQPKQLEERYGVARAADIRVPLLARSQAGNLLELPGQRLWPMPERVALVACYSGTDLASPEPFGLVTAFLQAGARLVTATRWTLLTDRAFASYQNPGRAGHPFNEAALVIDGVQACDADPVASLCTWQRKKLKAWRKTGALSDSPLTWAAFTTYDGRERRAAATAPAHSRED